jgi:BirA family biotin operon repressor/biotin-[acetyl-CoA-carboxylase] ligase
MTVKQKLAKSERFEVLISELASGQFHSGEALGRQMGISRAAVWKYVKSLTQLGFEVDSVRGRGYRIKGGLSLLDSKLIDQKLTEYTKQKINKVEVFKHIDSTNQYLLEKVESNQGIHGSVCLAEQQSAGRGRRGREWISPFGQNIYGSLLWRFEKGMSALEGLSLVVALSIVEAMKLQQIENVSLKWPNDILGNGEKLAGILLEVRGDLADYCDVVIGFGVNVNMPIKAGETITQAWTDVNTLSGRVVNRNDLLASILNVLVRDLEIFEEKGFCVFQERWNQYDGLMGKAAKIIAGKDQQVGLVKGVNAQGALLLELEGQVVSFHGGELSLRSVDETLD